MSLPKDIFFQLLILIVAYFLRKKAINDFNKAIESEIFDFGRYWLNPLTGADAVKRARIGIKLVNTLWFSLPILLVVYNIL